MVETSSFYQGKTKGKYWQNSEFLPTFQQGNIYIFPFVITWGNIRENFRFPWTFHQGETLYFCPMKMGGKFGGKLAFSSVIGLEKILGRH